MCETIPPIPMGHKGPVQFKA